MFAEASPPEFQSFASPEKATPTRDNASDVPNRRLTLRGLLVEQPRAGCCASLCVFAARRQRTRQHGRQNKLTKWLEETEAEMRFEWEYFCSHLIRR
jgi:hypothetical protein